MKTSIKHKNDGPVQVKPEYFFLKGYTPYLLLCIIGIALYIHTLGYDYSYLDDHVLVRENFQKINHLSPIKDIFNEDAFHLGKGSGFYYRPLMTLSFVLDATIGGSDNLRVFRLMNLVYHLIVCCLVFYLMNLMKVKKILAFCLGLLFCIHPLNIQAVVWVPGRNDILMGLFGIAAFIFFIRFIRENKILWGLPATILFACSLFSKESAILLPLLCLVYAAMNGRAVLIRALKLMTLWLPVIAVFLWMRHHALGNSNAYSVSELLRFIMSNLPAVFPYLGKVVFPFPLAQYPVMKDLLVPMVMGIVVLLGLSFLFIRTKNKDNTLFISGITWFFVFLLPALIISVDKSPNFSEHRMYVPMVGIFLFLAGTGFFSKLNMKNKVPLSVFIVVVLLYGALNVIHSKEYKDRVTFWKAAVHSSPSNAFNYNNLGAMYFLNNQLSEAEIYFREALKINPGEPLANANLGLVLLNTGRLEEAEPYCIRELKLNPAYVNAYFNLGVLYFKTERFSKGAEMMEKTLELDPYNRDAYRNLLNYYEMTDDETNYKRIFSMSVQHGVDHQQ